MRFQSEKPDHSLVRYGQSAALSKQLHRVTLGICCHIKVAARGCRVPLNEDVTGLRKEQLFK